MTYGLQVILLIFAAAGYLGAGVSLAVSRQRKLLEGTRDLGIVGVAGLLLLFAVLCTVVSVGILGVLAFGGLVLWASYLLMAQHIGLFRIEPGGPSTEEESSFESPRRMK